MSTHNIADGRGWTRSARVIALVRLNRRALVLIIGALAVFVAALFVLGLPGLIPFGLLVALSVRSDEEEPRRSVSLTLRNLGLAAAMLTAIVSLWLWYADFPEWTLVLIGATVVTLPVTLGESVGDDARDRTVVVTKRSLILALLGSVVFIYLSRNAGLWPVVFAAICVVLPLTLVSWRACRPHRVELGLLRHPLRREMRAHLVQGLNVWLCCGLIGGVLAAGGVHYARIGLSLNAAEFNVVVAVFSAGVLLLAALAVVPRRRVHVATNVVVALLSGSFALHLVSLSDSPTDPVVLDSPLTGEWFVFNGGRSNLINGHAENERNAIDFIRLGTNGRTHRGGGDAVLADYAGFGSAVLAPVDGRIVEVTDSNPDNPPGTNGDYANHLVMDIGSGRYVSLAHLKQGSVTAVVGDVVQRGQPLAVVGNSGHSNEPHLHMQVQDSPASMDADRTFPIVFRNVEINPGGVWPWGDNRELRSGDLIRALGS